MNVRGLARRVLPARMRPVVLAVRRQLNLAKGRGLKRRDRALKSEAAFWEGWFQRSDANLAERLDPSLTDPAVLSCLSRIDREQVSIIDVGAGPLSTLGTEAPGKQIRLVPVDPLAEDYARILAELEITPLVETQPCSGEDLRERFEPESFDIAFAENALDHASDPLRIIENMCALVRKDGFVVLNHGENEGERAAYADLHQWNFQQRGGRCVLWRPESEVDLETAVDGQIKCWTKPSDPPRVICVIEK